MLLKHAYSNTSLEINDNDQNEIVITERKQTHAPFSLRFCHVSLPYLASHNFCFSSCFLQDLFSLLAASQNCHLSLHWVLVAFWSLSWRWFLFLLYLLVLLRPDFLLSLFFIFPPFFVFLPAVVPWDNFSCCADAVSSLELRKNRLWQLRVADEFQAKQLFSEPSLDRPVLNL